MDVIHENKFEGSREGTVSALITEKKLWFCQNQEVKQIITHVEGVKMRCTFFRLYFFLAITHLEGLKMRLPPLRLYILTKKNYLHRSS